MKKMTYFVMALALALGFTQCKKEQIPTNNESEGVHITLTVDGGNNGSKVIVDPIGHTNPDYATVDFEEGDSIFVGYNNAYVGVLKYQGGSFSGNVNIETIVQDEHLHFYFLGGKGFRPTFTESGELSVNISHQAVKLPVISYAPSDEEFTTDNSSYSAKLKNKCSIMKFNVTKPAESVSAICITGMNNKVTLDFGKSAENGDGLGETTDQGFTYLKEGIGQIMMKGGTGASIETWAIVLPQAALEAGAAGTAYINDYEGTRPAINYNGGAIGSNQYISDATGRTIVIGSTPTGMLMGEFKVGDNKYVHFSKGNLQYQASTSTWQFAANQWACVGSDNSNISPTYSGWIDFFGWGTGNNPTLNDINGDYQTWNDWGTNAISNGGNVPNLWCTLSQAEWNYLLNTRAMLSYAKAKINEVNGLIVFPDNNVTVGSNSVSFNGVSISNPNNGNSGFVEYSSNDWSLLEAANCVFLPAAGNRYGTYVQSVGDSGCYWSSTVDSDMDMYSYGIFFSDEGFSVAARTGRFVGYSVRLVRPME